MGLKVSCLELRGDQDRAGVGGGQNRGIQRGQNRGIQRGQDRG